MSKRSVVIPILAILALHPRIAAAGARLPDFVEETTPLIMSPPVATVVSPDGAYTYVAGGSLGSIATFSRDGTGKLAFLALTENYVGSTGLGLAALALSPGGAHLYAAGENVLAVFSRDGGTGALTWVETQQNGVGGVTNLVNVGDVAISPDGAHVYVVSTFFGGLVIFSRNATTGALTFVQAMPDGSPNGLGGANAVAVSPDGAHVYVAAGGDDDVVVFSRDNVTGLLTLVETESLVDANDIALSPDGAHAYVTSYPDRLTVYSRNAGTGALTFEQALVDGAGGITAMNRPVAVAVTSDGAHVYVGAYYDSAVVVFSRNAGTGQLTLVEEKVNNVGGTFGLGDLNGLAASPDGTNIYVTTGYIAYYPSALTVFSRNAGTGALTQIQHMTTDLPPSLLVLSPDGEHLYGGIGDAYYGRGDRVSVYARDGGTGTLTRERDLDVADGIGGINGLDDVSALAFSPDGAHLYVAASTDSTITVFSRNATTGALTLVEEQTDGVGGVDGLNRVNDVVVSPDGAYLYASGYNDQAVSVFARNPGTGALTQTQVVRNGIGGVTGISYPDALALSPDGAHLYVSGDDVATFSRNAGTGALTFLGSLDEPNFGPTGVTMSPDGAFVYLHTSYFGASAFRDQIRIYARDAGTGALTFASRIKSNEGGLDFNFALGRMVFTADGGAAYVGGSIFSRNPQNGALGFVARGPNDLGYAVALGPLGEVYASSFRSVNRFAGGFAGCDGGPMPVCRAASGGRVSLNPRAPLVSWSWIGAAAVMPSDFGDPTTTDHYTLCMWDESGPTPTLILRSLATAGQQCSSTKACWASTTTGFKYTDRFRTPEGISALKLAAGAADAAKITFSARRENLAFPTLPLATPIRVQLQSSAGACFEATYSSPRVNNGLAFAAVAD